jgi:hypothetical protein
MEERHSRVSTSKFDTYMFLCISLLNILRNFLDNFPIHTQIYGAVSGLAALSLENIDIC